MRTSAPKRITWWIALLLAVLGVVGHFVAIPVLSTISFWLALVAALLLLLATVVRGL